MKTLKTAKEIISVFEDTKREMKLLILLILLTGCTSRLATVRPTRHKAIGKYVKADTVTRRPRYNHWAKPYEL